MLDLDYCSIDLLTKMKYAKNNLLTNSTMLLFARCRSCQVITQYPKISYNFCTTCSTIKYVLNYREQFVVRRHFCCNIGQVSKSETLQLDLCQSTALLEPPCRHKYLLQRRSDYSSVYTTRRVTNVREHRVKH